MHAQDNKVFLKKMAVSCKRVIGWSRNQTDQQRILLRSKPPRSIDAEIIAINLQIIKANW